MAQAANVIAFPGTELTFKPMKIDGLKVMRAYDRNRAFIAVAVKVLTMTPLQIKQSIPKMQKHEPVSHLIEDLERLSKDCIAMGEMLDTAAARLIVVSQTG